MRLQVRARILTGVEMFDHALGAMTIWQDAVGGPVLLASSGRNGGMSSWRVTATGDLELADTAEFAGFDLAGTRNHVVLTEHRGMMVGFFSEGSAVFAGQQILPDGQFGPTRRAGFDRVEAGIEAGDFGYLALWALIKHDAPDMPVAPDSVWQDTRAIAPGDDGDLLMISAMDNALHHLSAQGAHTRLMADLGLAVPSDMVLLPDAGAGARVVVAGAGSSSLSVLRLEGLQASDHVLDTASTAFRAVQTLSAAQVATSRGPMDLVLAGGGDHGITLFAVTPDGRLVWLDTVFDTPDTGLHNLTSLVSTQQDDRLVVVAASERDPGLSVLHVPLSNLGGWVTDGQGGGLDDILIARPGVQDLTGGAGADIFVILTQEAAITIHDFQPGQDRLDLTDWPMLRDIGQLSVQSQPDGAVIGYRGYQLVIHAASGESLDASALFPWGLQGPDKVMVQDTQDLEAVYGADPGPPPFDPDPMPPPPADPDPPSPDPPPIPVGAQQVWLRDESGAPLADVLVTFTLSTGGMTSTRSTATGAVDLPEAAMTALAVTRAWSPGAGDPTISALDALDVLRLAVGLAPSFGPAQAQNFIAADINGDGQVTALDALDVLRAAVGLTSQHAPEWVFFDAATDWAGLEADRNAVNTPETGIDLAASAQGTEFAMTGILLGSMDAV